MRIVSGIQPTGNLHLGNYLGAIRNWVRMQDQVASEGGDCLFFLADLHAISMPHVPADLTANTRAMTAALVACGIDPDRSTLFNQARVPAHAELQWLLNGTARIGWLNRMTQFKDKSGKNREGASAALYTYPVLQAADCSIRRRTSPSARTRSSIWSWRVTSRRSSTMTMQARKTRSSPCPNRSSRPTPRGS
jgi:tryptophanyl-tRNA synthetase